MAPIVGPAGPLAVAKPGDVAIVGRRLPPAYRAKAPWPAASAGPKHSQPARRSSDQPLSITTGRGPKLPVGPPTPQVRRDKCSGWLPSLDRSSALYRAFIARFDLEHVTFGHESLKGPKTRSGAISVDVCGRDGGSRVKGMACPERAVEP